MGIKFKKISQTDTACIYALREEICIEERDQLINWLEIHCDGFYILNQMHLILDRQVELFFKLTYPLS